MDNGDQLIHSFNDHEGFQGNFKGLTKREYFAGLAMQGILSNREFQLAIIADIHLYAKHGCNHYNCFSFHSVIHADELLKQLEK